MNLGELTHRQHALISMGILVLGLILVSVLFAGPAVAIRHELNDTIESLELQLHKFKQVGSGLAQLQQQIDQLNKTYTNTGDFLAEKSPALAAADLQQYVKGIIESQKATLISAQPTNDAIQDLFPRVTIKITMRGNIESLQNILYRLEFSKPRLFIDNLIVQKRVSSDNPSLQKDANVLDVRFDLTGYVFNSKL